MPFTDAPITIALVVANIALSFVAFQSEAFMRRNLFVVGPILQDGQYHRMVTSGFLHLNILHLVVNMYVLYEFGPTVEHILGSATFAALYAVSLVGGSAWSLLENRRHPRYSAVGASGATSGVVFVFCLFLPNETLGLFFAIPMPAWFLAISYFAVSAYFSTRPNTRIGHDAHLGGMLFGGGFVFFLYPGLWTHFMTAVSTSLGTS